jgi:5,10-methylenetetrahydromethanopterin reductase
VAKELGDGLFTVNCETDFAKEFSWAALGVHGTVLADREALDSPRVRAAAGPGNALAYHAAHEFGGDVSALPAGQVWLDTINETPSKERLLAIRDHHLIGPQRGRRSGCPPTVMPRPGRRRRSTSSCPGRV